MKSTNGTRVCFGALSFAVVLMLNVCCSGATQIQTSPPQPASPDVASRERAERMSLLTVEVQIGETSLPAEVMALRYRVAEVHLKEADGGWSVFPAELNSFEITANRRTSKTVLSTHVPPIPYDSLALVLSDVFVVYDANAGGPLTMPRGESVKLGFDARPQAGSTTEIQLTFEPGASLTKDNACRWYFLPFLTSAGE